MIWRWESVAALLTRFNLTSSGVEVGVKEGKFSAHLLTVFPALKMTGVDPYEPQPQSESMGYADYRGWNFKNILTALDKNTSKFGNRFVLLREYSLTAAAKFEPQSVDFVFIDAQHTYDGVREDILAWKDKIKPGGILCGHDYDFTRPRFADVIRAVDDYAGPVQQADDHVWWRAIE